ncbi:NADH-quinone oxidoreductase subunit NuoH [Tuwongella immobilis]|uniref:NADH-quinone oxidoreductase subunit H n=1 Tax=Tuwongella immobilis TaxID=692036 RepID=A0A6C2YPY3_9BACT|nr:NADH-quinone oxidoreductase subunit NuoH [Tuwongella immobilis]VIP03183.1 nadh dehydrogenase : NADH-quinone oxidoreductase subunit H OS=Pirellula staleyi (strain ATCC 27377 / DSM 6068 / ICPB 4128) GN=nuoH PE=3 SV=1: NADHdh [Tuwongella immobilis]VTS03636.1 nadh dehydrogenase : NADH-quinone oxidoreductase subunit H OS=Pirellula staleyi (strain ATCC 27377 / DSM 6068 / ICPB 4128) GN=nuoH PE=3 SV=1: NADHdh [Tuwongella immobilis]
MFFGYLSDWPAWAVLLLSAGIAAGVIVSYIAVQALFLIWAERKVAGRIQDRLGPTRVGGRFGWLQTVADGIKLLTKEDTVPKAADGFLFRIAPYLAFCASFAAFIVLPFSARLVGWDLGIAAFFMLAVLSSEVFGVILAGYASGSKWSLFGAIREAAQVVSYEIPRSLCVLIVVVTTGTLSLTAITQQQSGGFWNWNLFHDPFTFAAFWIFFIVITASCKRAPFDLAEAESELVAGFHTEYSGLRWSFFFMAEYASMFAECGLAVFLFLGGWNSGLLPFQPVEQFGLILGSMLDASVFIGKSLALVFVMMWLRWSLPRLRIDQVMTTCLQYLLPISCVLLMGVCLWRLMVTPDVQAITRYVLAGGLVGLKLLIVVRLLSKPMTSPVGRLGGVWEGMQTPGMRSRKEQA